MITNDTHKIDWNKTAQVTGVVLMVMAMGAWWVAQQVGRGVFAVLSALLKIFMALVSVWASLPNNSSSPQERTDPSRAVDPNNLGHDMMGRPINIHRNYYWGPALPASCNDFFNNINSHSTLATSFVCRSINGVSSQTSSFYTNNSQEIGKR